jgi:hypothetical protein
MFLLVRVASSEYWFSILVDCVRPLNPNFVCFKINNYDDFTKYGFNGCGTAWGLFKIINFIRIRLFYQFSFDFFFNYIEFIHSYDAQCL